MATVAMLGVADIVESAPVPVEEIADRVGANASALYRVMRLLAMDGIFSEVRPGAFVATELSNGIREGAPHSIRHMAMLHGGPSYQAASRMLECVRTGEPAAEAVFGKPFFEYLAADSEVSDIFNRAMAGGARARLAAALDHDWSAASTVADIGGGNGALLSAVLAAQQHLRGIVFDLPHVVSEARPVIEETGVADRCELVAGDFFEDALPGADTYLLAQILHDWDDERAVAILRNCRRSIAQDGRLLVLEFVLPEGDQRSYAKVIDLIMLTLLGGRERTHTEWGSLLGEGGFELVGVTTKPAASLIECAPA